MTRFLAIIRRTFMAGTISLIVLLIAFGTRFSSMLDLAKQHNSVEGYFSIYFLASPIVFITFSIISVVFIRHHGQFAAVHQSHSPLTTFFKCLGADVISPFKNIKNFFLCIFSKNVMGRGKLIARFIELVIIFAVCIIGINLLR